MSKKAQEKLRKGDTSFVHDLNRIFKCCIFHDAYHAPPPPPEVSKLSNIYIGLFKKFKA